jgi:hypothetical protein
MAGPLPFWPPPRQQPLSAAGNTRTTFIISPRQTTTMKLLRTLATSAIAVGASLLFSATSHAQSSLGIGLSYGAEIEAVGLDGRFYYELNKKPQMRIAAGLVYYFVDDPLTFYTIDGNFHYGLADFSGGFAYGIGGLQIAIAGATGFDSDSDVGLNLGVGAEFKVPFGGIPVEVKYVVGNADQLVLSGGLRFSMN